MLTIRLILGRKLLVGGDEYVVEVVNGRLSECVVDEKESSKGVEGCRLEVRLSSISPQMLRQVVATLGVRGGIQLCLSPRRLKRVENCVGLYMNCRMARRSNWRMGDLGQLRCQIGSLCVCCEFRIPVNASEWYLCRSIETTSAGQCSKECD